MFFAARLIGHRGWAQQGLFHRFQTKLAKTPATCLRKSTPRRPLEGSLGLRVHFTQSDKIVDILQRARQIDDGLTELDTQSFGNGEMAFRFGQNVVV